ncbi:MAG: hypothetical protein R3A12_13050 [Ignavibacteria bacterium]
MDGGLTWSTPIKIYDANPAVDTLGAFRGLSMVYLGNTPCVTFEVDYITETGFSQLYQVQFIAGTQLLTVEFL